MLVISGYNCQNTCHRLRMRCGAYRSEYLLSLVLFQLWYGLLKVEPSFVTCTSHFQQEESVEYREIVQAHNP